MGGAEYVPPTDEMTPLEKADQWLGGSQADEDGGLERAADARRRRALFNIPRRWSIDRGHRDLGLLHGPDDSREGFADLAREAEACIRMGLEPGSRLA